MAFIWLSRPRDGNNGDRWNLREAWMKVPLAQSYLFVNNDSVKWSEAVRRERLLDNLNIPTSH